MMMMLKVAGVVLLLCAALAYAEPRQPQRNGMGMGGRNALVAPQHPYLFLTSPRGRSGAVVQGFEVLRDQNDDDESSSVSNDAYEDDYDNDEQHDDDEAEEEEEDDEEVELPQRNPIALKIEDEDELGLAEENDDNEDNSRPVMNAGNFGGAAFSKRPNLQLITKNAKPTHMTVPRENAGAIMVPDGIIEIEGQSVIDEKTGKAALLVPRAALDAIPSGSVVALMERSLDETAEERANRVVVRRRRKGSRRNVRRRGSSKRRRGGNNRRRVNKRKNVRVIQAGGGTRRRGNRRGSRRPTVIQG